jgi:hypothetical protein
MIPGSTSSDSMIVVSIHQVENRARRFPYQSLVSLRYLALEDVRVKRDSAEQIVLAP